MGLDTAVSKGLITASRLNHNVFRQGIMAKYLVYSPPKPLFPFELITNLFRPSSAISTATGQIGGNGEVLLGV